MQDLAFYLYVFVGFWVETLFQGRLKIHAEAAFLPCGQFVEIDIVFKQKIMFLRARETADRFCGSGYAVAFLAQHPIAVGVERVAV